MQFGRGMWMRGVVAACGLAAVLFVAPGVRRAAADEKGAAAGGAAAQAAPSVIGAWEYGEDRTAPEHRRDPRERPPLGKIFKVSLDGATYVVEHARMGTTYVCRVAPDGAESVQQDGATTRTTYGSFDAGVLTLKERVARERGGQISSSETEFRLTPTAEGLLVRMLFTEPVRIERTALYRATADIPAPTPAKADLTSLAWLEGRFTVSGSGRGGKPMEMEEHWGPAGGGAMLGTARTVADGRMTSFEFLRIVERNGGLVYVAQPNGGTAVEFVLTEISATRALFENPRHDYPKRIVYERLPASKDGRDGLRTEISDTDGARANAVAYTRAQPRATSDE